jgi:hypothetical protein
MPTKRTPINRGRKSSLLIDEPAVKLFARLERVPVPWATPTATTPCTSLGCSGCPVNIG